MAIRLDSTLEMNRLMLADTTIVRAADLLGPVKAAIDADIAYAVEQDAMVPTHELLAADTLSLDDSLVLTGTAEPVTLDDPLLA